MRVSSHTRHSLYSPVCQTGWPATVSLRGHNQKMMFNPDKEINKTEGGGSGKGAWRGGGSLPDCRNPR